ncbi:hydroxyacylglutathione hydrolase [Aquitalea sp.]|uniref:hydroxyacylglutathione hydrolase n=1 Tax=Aquitalea sp. TaxID=1872623 RepID=UPI002587B3F2|nr:hydroxyacylglutathione hydrolase [Aquitalea sp.]
MFTVTPVRAFADNYIWVLQQGTGALAVDPGEAAPLIAFLDQRGLALQIILITHHHADHCGGLAELLQRWPQAQVYGPPGIAGVNQPVMEGASVHWHDYAFDVLALPGHTLDHLGYYGHGQLFCGDTLFGAGCGRLFEGSPAQMLASLDKLAALPDTTRFYPAHEYTLSNLKFALAVEPDNDEIQLRQLLDQKQIAMGLPTLPTELGLEKTTNPFMRSDIASVQYTASRHTGQHLSQRVEVFTVLREWKNNFR